jgi:hypothetical protein
MKSNNWKTALVILAALVSGAILARGGVLPGVQAQMGGRTSDVICVVAPLGIQDTPVILVDTREQTILCYEYDVGSDDLEFNAARTYRFDKMLRDYQTQGPSVDSVEDYVKGEVGRLP